MRSLLLCCIVVSVTSGSDLCQEPDKEFSYVCNAKQKFTNQKSAKTQEECRFVCVATSTCAGYKYNKTEEVCIFYGEEKDESIENQTIWLSRSLVSDSHWKCECLNAGTCDMEKCQCDCKPGFYGKRCEQKMQEDCMGVHSVNSASGVYVLYQPDSAPYQAFCEEGWTLIMRRVDGSQNFNLSWSEYKKGFGNLNKEFWMGNDLLHKITKQKAYKLRIDITSWDTGELLYAEYDQFEIGNETIKYQLNVSGFLNTSSADDAFSGKNNGQYFSTIDQDNDSHEDSCAARRKGGFWFRKCSKISPTGLYKKDPGVEYDCVHWATQNEEGKYQPSDYFCLSAISMKIKPKLMI